MTQPNLILILTDHFRRDALGPHTPHLLELAQQGVRFANAYCSAPLCQPARNALITGMWPSDTGICGNQSAPLSDALRGDTFMHQLQAAGYYTALVGKHHYLDRYGIGMDVVEDDAIIRAYGFDSVHQVVDDGENGHNDDRYTRYLRELGLLEEFRAALARDAWQDGRHPFDADDTADGYIGRQGLAFIEGYDRAQPFYLNLSFIGPHPPYWHPGDLAVDPQAIPGPLGQAADAGVLVRRAHYLTKCALIDRYVGQLVALLRAKGLLENTVLIFTSDHGDMLGDFGIWDKRHFYEASVGVPLILSGAGVPAEERLNGPRVSRLLVTHADLFPTILALAGAPGSPDRRRGGRDLLAMLRGAAPPHGAVYAELATAVMIRTGNWKLVFDPEQGGVQALYNLVSDPGEEHNLAGMSGYEHITLDLIARLLAQRILRTQYTHVKEEQRLQRVRTDAGGVG